MTTNTALALMTKAYADAQKIAVGASLSTAQQADGLDRLNDIINFQQTQSLKLFFQSEQSVTLVAGQSLYVCMPGGDVSIARPLRVLAASYVDQYGNSRDLDPISRSDWTSLTGRSNMGSVNQYFSDKQFDRLNLNLWQTPDATAATGTLRVVFATQATDPATVNSGTTFPPEWYIFLRWALAADVCSGSSEAIVQRCETKAAFYKTALEAFDVEEAPTRFAPNLEMMSPSSFSA